MKKAPKRPDRENCCMTQKHDMAKLMKAKANSSAFKEGQHKDLAKLSSPKQLGGK